MGWPTKRFQRLVCDLLAADERERDFGIYQQINRHWSEIDPWLKHDLPALLQQADSGGARWVFEMLSEFFGDLPRRLQSASRLVEASSPPSKPPSKVGAYHVHAPSPLPKYAFRLPSGRRVQFRRLAAAPSTEEAPAASLRRLVLVEQSLAVVDERELSITWQEVFPESGKQGAKQQAVLNRSACEGICSFRAIASWVEELTERMANIKGRPTWLAHHVAAFTQWHERSLVIQRQLGPRLLRVWDRFLLSETFGDQLAAGESLAEGGRRPGEGLPVNCDEDPHPSAAPPPSPEGSRIVDAWRQMQIARDIGRRIIGWLAARETCFEELLDAEPVVAESNYCLTLDRVPRQFHAEIFASARQLAAWQQHFGIEAGSLLSSSSPGKEFVEAHPFLPLDTAHFSAAFRDRLVTAAGISDATVDGLLIQGENYDALRLLRNRYAEQVRCVVIDPPYNTGVAAWTFNDRFHHDHWSAMMHDRLQLARELLAADGSIFVTLDDHEQARLQLLMEQVFGEENYLATIIWEKVHTRKNSARHFSVSHDYIPAFAKDKARWQRQLLPRSDTRAYANPDEDQRGAWKPDPIYANKPYATSYRITKPNGVVLDPPAGRYWRLSEANFLEKAARGEVLWGTDGAYPMVKRYLADVQDGLVPVTLFTREFAGDNAEANAELRAMLGGARSVSYPKPSRLVKRILQIATPSGGNDTVLDFFAGSGTTGQAVIQLNREDGGRRKYILVEQADYFQSVLKPRILKAAYSSGWHAGQPTTCDGMSQTIKCLRLESFEERLCAERRSDD
jgi:DNA modification methylase